MSKNSNEKTALSCLLACIVLGAIGIVVLGKNIIAGEEPSSPKLLLGAALTVVSFCFGAVGMDLLAKKTRVSGMNKSRFGYDERILGAHFQQDIAFHLKWPVNALTSKLTCEHFCLTRRRDCIIYFIHRYDIKENDIRI